jgi:hypothetical protein
MKNIFKRAKTTRLGIIMAVIVLWGLVSGAGPIHGQTCAGPVPGLVDWWTGDRSPLDMAGTNNGTLMNGATYGPGKVSQAFSFTGASDSFVDIPDNTSLNPAGAFSVDGWFYIDPSDSGVAGRLNTLVSKGDGYPPHGGWDLAYDDRSGRKILYLLLNEAGGNYLELTQDGAITTPGWHHIAAVFDPATSPQAKVYLNGSVAADSGTGSISSIATNAMTMRIGAMHWMENFDAGSDRLKGMADEVHYFNRALSSLEIGALYNAGSAGICPVTEPSFPLRQGWNFISLPKLPPSDDIPTVLADVQNKVTIIWGWGSVNQVWQKWTPSGGPSNTLLSLDTGKGYWIYMQTPGAIDVSQWAAVENPLPSALDRGWNLIGYNGTNGLPVSGGLQVISGQWSTIWNWTSGVWNAQAVPDLPASVGALTNLYLGRAYWVKMKVPYTPQYATWDTSLWDNAAYGP